MTKLLMVDLDGTIRRCKSDPAGFINKPEDQELIPGAVEALTDYFNKGWIIVGISNQAGVHYGHKTLDSCLEEQRHTLKLAKHLLSTIYICPDLGDICWEVFSTGGRRFSRDTIDYGFRKPDPGMLILAVEEFINYWEEDSVKTLYVGDREEDKLAAEAAGIEFIDAAVWRGEAE